MKKARPQTRPNQARYAHLSALLLLRIAELKAALGRDEIDHQNWDHPEMLFAVDCVLAEALAIITRRADPAALRAHKWQRKTHLNERQRGKARLRGPSGVSRGMLDRGQQPRSFSDNHC